MQSSKKLNPLPLASKGEGMVRVVVSKIKLGKKSLRSLTILHYCPCLIIGNWILFVICNFPWNLFLELGVYKYALSLSPLWFTLEVFEWGREPERGCRDKIPFTIIFHIYYHILTTWRSPDCERRRRFWLQNSWRTLGCKVPWRSSKTCRQNPSPRVKTRGCLFEA